MAENAESQPENETAEEASEAAPAYCRWCGKEWAEANESANAPLGDGPPSRLEAAGGDWLCPHCERYQDAGTCPTCGGNARLSALPENLRPEPHKPVRSRGKG